MWLMRFLHTADWHLGRLFHGVHLTDDQRHVLEQVVEIARDGRPDVVLVAGDVYDRAVPPPEAGELLDEGLSRLPSGVELAGVFFAGDPYNPRPRPFCAPPPPGPPLPSHPEPPRSFSPP